MKINNSVKKSPLDKKGFALLMTLFVIILPLAVSLGLGYYLDYISGDVQLVSLYDILNTLSEFLTNLLPYCAVAAMILLFYYYSGIRRAGGIALCFISLLIPYMGSVFAGFLLIPDFKYNFTYYLLLFLLNGLLFKLLPMFVSLIATDFTKMQTGDNDHGIDHAAKWSSIFFFLPNLIYEIYLTFSFFHDLKYLYARAPKTGEIFSIIAGYVICTVYALAGYLIIKLIIRLLTTSKDTSSQENE